MSTRTTAARALARTALPLAALAASPLLVALHAQKGAAEAAGAVPASAPAPGATGVVRGTVTDENGEPIAAVRVRVVELHREEQTHDQGAFLLELPVGRWVVSFQRLGYRPENRTVTVAEHDTVRLEVRLTQAVLTLQATVVTGQLREREGQDALSPTGVLSGAALDRSVGGTVAASLQGQAGVSIASTGPSTARPVIRGMGGDRILVLEDGQRPGDLSSTSGDHAVAIDPLTARQMEVVRGPMSLLYGPSALGGVVNVVRDEVPTSMPDHAHGSVSVQGTSVNSGGSVGAVATAPLAGFALRAEGTYRAAGSTHTPVGVMRNTDLTSFGGSLGAARAGERGHAGVSYRYYDNDYGIPGGFAGAEENGVDIAMRRHTLRGEGELHREGKTWSSLRVTAIGTDYAHQEIEGTGEVATDFRQKVAATDVLARHEGAGPFALGAVGGRVQYRDVTTGGELKTPSTRDFNAAGFVVEELGRGPVRLQLGARYDFARFDPEPGADSIAVGDQRVAVRARTFGSASGAAAVLWEPRADVRVGASVGRAFRTPDFNELYSNGPHLAAYSYDVGDPRLKEETGVGVDVFARLTRDRVRAEVAAFRNAMSNYISPSSRGRAVQDAEGRPIFQYTNEDARFSGAEGSLELGLTRRLVLEGTLSYVRAEFTNARADLPVFTRDAEGNITDTTFVAASRYPSLIPPLNGQANLRWESPRWFAGAGVRFADRQERTGDFETPTAGYGVANVTAGLRLPVRSRLHLITLRVDNLFDQAYREHLSRTKDVIAEPGRNVSLLYRLDF